MRVAYIEIRIIDIIRSKGIKYLSEPHYPSCTTITRPEVILCYMSNITYPR